MDGFLKNIVQFIGLRILVANRHLKPKIGGNGSSGEESCVEQEAIYLIGLADGLKLASLLATKEQTDG